MILSNLDTITRRGLLEDGLPIQYYFELLLHGATCVRELSFDTLKIVNFANLPVGDYGEVNLPDDFVDDVAVAIPVAGILTNLPKQDNLNPIRIHSTTTGAFTPYTTNTQTEDNNTFFGFPGAWTFYWNVNDYGEPTGRFYGSPGGTQQGYKVIKERRQIQMTDNFIGSNIVLSYISDGQRADNATQIDVMAFQTIRAFQEWKRDPAQANDENSPKARAYYNQRRLLRARLDDLTIIDLKNVLRNNYMGAPKS